MWRVFRELIHHLMDSRRKARENFSDINCFRRFRQDDLPKARQAAERRPTRFDYYSSFLEPVNRYLHSVIKSSPDSPLSRASKKACCAWNSVYKAFAEVYRL